MVAGQTHKALSDQDPKGLVWLHALIAKSHRTAYENLFLAVVKRETGGRKLGDGDQRSMHPTENGKDSYYGFCQISGATFTDWAKKNHRHDTLHDFLEKPALQLEVFTSRVKEWAQEGHSNANILASWSGGAGGRWKRARHEAKAQEHGKLPYFAKRPYVRTVLNDYAKLGKNESLAALEKGFVPPDQNFASAPQAPLARSTTVDFFARNAPNRGNINILKPPSFTDSDLLKVSASLPRFAAAPVALPRLGL